MNYDHVKQMYTVGLYPKEVVAYAVRIKVITPEQYAEITGEPFAK